MWLEEIDGSVVCGDCDRRMPPNIDLCPQHKCLSYEKNQAEGSTTAAMGGVPSTRYSCKKCGRKYSSNSCLRVPYVWFFFMTNGRGRGPHTMIE